MENKEKGVGRTIQAVLTFLYELRVIRQRYSLLERFVFCVEVLFVLNFPLQHSLAISDPRLDAVAQVYETYIINGQLTMLIFSLLSFLFLLLAMLALLSLYSQSRLQYASRLQRLHEKARRFYLAVFIIFEGIVVPALLLTVQNIVNHVIAQILIVSYINLPFLVVLVLLEKERRIYRGFVVLLVGVRIAAEGLMPVVMGAVSLRLGWREEGRVEMKIVYYQLAIWNAFIVVCKHIGEDIDSFYLLFSLVVTVALVLFNSEEKYCCNPVKSNRKLMELVEILAENKVLSLRERMFANREICRFREQLKACEKFYLTQQERQWLQQGKQGIQKDDLVVFMQLKMGFDLRREYSHQLKMQSLECEVRFKTFNMKILYEIERLVQEVKNESTYEEQEKLYQLVSLTDRKFLKKGQTVNANTVIAVEKETEQLYGYFIDIAVVMQELWTIHHSSNLTEPVLKRVLAKVAQMEEESERILGGISKYNFVRHEMVIFEMVKRLNNNSYKPREFNQFQFERAKDEITNGEYLNYILIEQGNILDMSNQLLNEFQLTKKEAEGYRLRDIVNEQLNSYLSVHIDHLIEEEVDHEQANFILPLKLSRDNPYIQPFKAKISLLPELINGIKYIIHLEKSTDLQKTPFFLYSGRSDSIIGITKNLKQYFRMDSDHYIFRDYTHEIFNVDILSVFNQNKDFQTIICEFSAKLTSSTLRPNKHRQVPVILKNIKQYENGEDSLILMSIVKREEFERTEMSNLISEKLLFERTKMMLAKNSVSSGRIHSHESCVRFCKISNPYENLIDEKISKMSEFYRMSYLKCVLFLVAAIVLALLVALAVMIMQTKSYSARIVSDYDSNILHNDQAINLFQLYTESSILYQLHHYPQHYTGFNSKLNISQLMDNYSAVTNQNIKSILTSQVQSKVNGDKQYGQNATIYDIAEDAKEAIVSRSISSLILSWPSLRYISANETFTAESIKGLSHFFKYFSTFCISLIFFLVLAIEVVSFRIQDIFHEIIYLYEKIDKEHSRKFVEIYRFFAHELYSSIYFRGVRSNHYLQLYKNKNNLENIQEMNTLIYMEEHMHFDLQRQETANTGNAEGSIKRDVKLAFVWKDSFIFILVLSLTGFLAVVIFHTHSYQVQYTAILGHSEELHQGRGNVSFNAAYFMVTSLQQTIPQQSRLVQSFPDTMFLETEVKTDLPPFYNSYLATMQRMISKDLCSTHHFNTDALYAGMECEKVLGGMLTVGFAESLVMYNDLVNNYLFNNMSNFSNLKRTQSFYPSYLQILYIKVGLFGILSYLQKTFISYTHNYIKIWNDRLSWLINLGWVLLPLAIVLTGCLYCRIRSRCSICLKSFFILPKEYLLQMKVTKILRQKNILDHIEKLAF